MFAFRGLLKFETLRIESSVINLIFVLFQELRFVLIVDVFMIFHFMMFYLIFHSKSKLNDPDLILQWMLMLKRVYISFT